MTFRRMQAIALAQAKQQAADRAAVITALAEDGIRQIEQHLKEVAR
jgi:hypothetical protein